MAAFPEKLEPKSCSDVLAQINAGSPFLHDLVQRYPDLTVSVFSSDPQILFERLIDETLVAGNTMPRAALHAALRQLKSKAALLIALCDLANLWDFDHVTAALTRFADAAISAGVKTLLREAGASDAGYVVLAMGKHGAGELNYSSDVDLIIFYDAETAVIPGNAEPSTFFVKLTRQLVALLQDVDEYGYVFRIDLRLRPDPRATQVAIALESAAVYYENMGQNWERAAYIKARPIAGDIALGEAFLERLVPYVWRRYLDFASIADVQSLIRQIHAVKGHGDIAIEGHNLKLGRGGIREIEFFVQTQQLIAGGRNVKLRGRRTVEMLHALSGSGWISHGTATEMEQAYVFLRTLEHRAQMQNDQQTHMIPGNAEAFRLFANFANFPDGNALRNQLRQTLECVSAHSSKLFAESTELAGDAGSLVFTGGEDDPATIETLQQMGFRQASEVSATIRGWHFGRYPATRDKRTREALTELKPRLLKALAQSGDADGAFLAFDRFLRGLPAGVQLLAMLKSNPRLLDLLALILGTAPRLAEGMAKQPRVLEAVLDPSFFGPLPTKQALSEMLSDTAPATLSLDEVMDRVRVFKREQCFRVGVRVLSETVAAEVAGEAFSNIADVVVARLFEAVRDDIEKSHGTVENGVAAVIAMGKLGGRETTASSDLDLIVVFDHASDAFSSSGARPLAPAQYFSRFAQRLVTALSVLTAEGALYDVDMRLRPSGSKGPVAVSFSAFETYQREEAWTWERMALTRARTIAGDHTLCNKLEAAILEALTTVRDASTIRKDVNDMRKLMLEQHKPSSIWDIKRAKGGLVEIEFIAQYLQLTAAPHAPQVLNTNTQSALKALAPPDSEVLIAACQLYHRLTQLLRLCLETDYDSKTALPGLNRALANCANVPSVAHVEDFLRETQEKVAHIFTTLVGR
jgi:[glutamine synthetase] adenylyltransferase / [glutamine synthetase]-adenylyl-L-tyrosine phosphorylase